MRNKAALMLAAALGSYCVAFPAFAQDAQSDSPTAGDGEIVVTGTRIRTPNLKSSVPITSLGSEEITATGNVFVGELIDQLPSTHSTLNQQNSSFYFGLAGVNAVDLRGLGLERTLVLQNGRRHVSVSPGVAIVDVSTIPTDLVDRIDIVTGGNSAIYGSDAVAGVVNFVLKDHFSGIQARGQSGISSRGDRGSYRLSLTAGQNFAEGRGNVAVSAEYTQGDAVYIRDRANVVGSFGGFDDFAVVEPPNGEPNGTDGIPDRIFVRGIRYGNQDPNGLFIADSSGYNAVNGACATAAGCRPNGRPRIFKFGPGGTLAEVNYGIDLRGQNNGASSNFITPGFGEPRHWGQLVPGVERYSINALGHFDVSRSFTPYFEAKYARVNFVRELSPNALEGAPQAIGDPAAEQEFGVFGAGFSGAPIRFDNAFLDPSAATLIKSLLPAGTQSFRLNRVNYDFGIIGERGHRETYRFVGGVRGDFNEDWHYDLSVNYGRFEQSTLFKNNIIAQRFNLAVDAVRNPANGQIVCRSQLPGQVTAGTGNPADAAALAADIAACVPINLFGEGSPSQAALNYILVDVPVTSNQKQTVVSGFVSGDFSQLFELPGGPVGFAVGAEWRQEDGFQDFGELVRSGRTSVQNTPLFNPKQKFEVKEVFGELNVPLLKDRPFFEELSLSGAARLADYSGRTGRVLAWNAGGVWAPVRDIRFRANYAVSVRAPTQFDLYSEAGQGGSELQDPCTVTNISNGSSSRSANCAAAGIPAGFTGTSGAAILVSVGGNPLLKEETSKSWTLGAVFQPRFIPGFSLSVDYYNIRINDAIAQLDAQQIVDNCYDSPFLQNFFCSLVFRDPTTHNFSNNPPFYGVITGGVNFASLTARGIDFDAAYRTDISGLGNLALRLIGTYNLERNDYPFVDRPNQPDQILLEPGTPRVELNFSLNLRRGPVTFGYQARYLSKQSVARASFGGIENIVGVGGNPPRNADWADVRFLPSVTYHDFRIGFDVDKHFNFYLGVDNAFDRLPPYARFGINTDRESATYDNIGRFFYAGVGVNF